MRPLHRAVALLACGVVPALTVLFDRGSIGYTMYAGTTAFRVDIEVERGGAPERVACSQVAPLLSGTARPFLAGADSFRPARSTVALRAHLADVARAACLLTKADRAKVTLEEMGAPTVVFGVPCR